MAGFELKARAKINLGLWVLDRLPTGFHEILTVFHRISLHDTIRIEEADTLEVVCPGGPEGPENLVYRAVRELEKFVGRELPVKIGVEKRIPMGRGMGGGSSDAAATLLALDRLYELELSKSELIEVGAGLGSDIPFFILDCPAALGKGKGEVLEPVESTLEAEVRVVDPGFPVDTAWAYEQIDAMGEFSSRDRAERGVEELIRALKAGDLDLVSNLLHNDFEELMFSFRPKTKKIKKDLARMGCTGTLLSGSGSAFFGLGRGLTRVKTQGRIFSTDLE
jgi:4-diphosphocytidyl-2-C-methyl-D-erythritol kinase